MISVKKESDDGKGRGQRGGRGGRRKKKWVESGSLEVGGSWEWGLDTRTQTVLDTYAQTHMHEHTHACTHTHTCTHTYTHMYVSMYVSLYIHVVSFQQDTVGPIAELSSMEPPPAREGGIRLHRLAQDGNTVDRGRIN